MTVAVSRESPPHAPEAGWVRRFLGPFYVTGVFWFRFHRWGVRILPPWAIYPLMLLFVGFFFLSLRNIRRAIGSNLQTVLGRCGAWERERRIFRTLWNFSWCLTERYERLSTERSPEVEAELEGDGIWRELAASGRGLIVVTAHLGAWEVGSAVPAARDGLRVHVVREEETDPKAQSFIAELIRSRSDGLYTTHFAGADDPHLGVALLEALRRGEVVALQADRPRTTGRSAQGRLFGRPFPLPIGPAALARAAGVPLVPVFVTREGRLRYRCSIRPPIEVARTSDRQADLEAALERVAGELEAAIRRTPYQWFCFRRLWD
jgi:phosphatidylinositol dimannoside acyltransferase